LNLQRTQDARRLIRYNFPLHQIFDSDGQFRKRDWPFAFPDGADAKLLQHLRADNALALLPHLLQ
jgi:hypothetical protein